ncbi:MAG: FecR domain-containing protein [Candidatus Riflebacteria bacterium]|nr:FecR domain-containing protein [Candidatus Riflebacteria bacterium]
MINSRAFSLFVCFILLFSFNASFAQDAPKPIDVKINIVTGQVKLTRVGKTLSDVFTSAFPLYAGDIIETMRESKAELTYADGTNMRMKPLTKIQVQDSTLKVFKGQTWYKFTKRGTEFLIETPSLVAGIRGTVFDISVTSKGKSMLSVMEGKVAVKGTKGNEVLVDQGAAVNCEPGGEPSNTYTFNIEKKKNEWLEGEWLSASGGDLEQYFINYLNLKAEYGPQDPRTLDAQRQLEDAKKRNSPSPIVPISPPSENRSPFRK